MLFLLVPCECTEAFFMAWYMVSSHHCFLGALMAEEFDRYIF